MTLWGNDCSFETLNTGSQTKSSIHYNNKTPTEYDWMKRETRAWQIQYEYMHLSFWILESVKWEISHYLMILMSCRTLNHQEQPGDGLIFTTQSDRQKWQLSSGNDHSVFYNVCSVGDIQIKSPIIPLIYSTKLGCLSSNKQTLISCFWLILWSSFDTICIVKSTI